MSSGDYNNQSPKTANIVKKETDLKQWCKRNLRWYKVWSCPGVFLEAMTRTHGSHLDPLWTDFSWWQGSSSAPSKVQ